MARTRLPLPNSGGGAMPKVVSAFVLVALMALVVKHPVDAAHVTTGGFSVLGDIVDGLMTFLQQVLG